ncbi:MAG TPA: hypothetical protein EYN67_03705 [Flavobacteriales bacterium]|nr:hypothetical protein [Flavobacteriales bacterium]
MNIDLTHDEIILLLDSMAGRMDDLNTCAMFGDGTTIGGELADLDELIEKLSDALNQNITDLEVASA